MLTSRQYELLVFIDRRIRETGGAPSYVEMMVHLGLKSKSGVHRIVTELVGRGFIRRTPNLARAIEVVRLPASASAEIGTAVSAAVADVLHMEIGVADTDGLIGALRARGVDLVGRAA